MLNSIVLKNKIEYENDHLQYIRGPMEIINGLKLFEI